MGFWQNKDTKRNEIEILGSPTRCITKKKLKNMGKYQCFLF